MEWDEALAAYRAGVNPRASRPFLTFFGLEEGRFLEAVAVARGGLEMASQVHQVEMRAPMHGGVSALRDGTVLGPVELFRPVATKSY